MSDVWKIIESYYLNNDLTSLQVESYNRFVHETVPSIIKEQYTVIPLNDTYSLYLHFQNVFMDKPSVLDANRVKRKLYPYEARERDLSYETSVVCDVELAMIENATNTVTGSQLLHAVELFKLPVMIASSLCNLRTTTECKNEETHNRGGYFIIKGKERVIVAQERINYNQVYVYKKKVKYQCIAEVRSVKEGADYSVMLQVKVTTSNQFVVTIPYISSDIPLAILCIAMGLGRGQVMGHVAEYPAFAIAIDKAFRSYEHMTTDECVDYISQYTLNKVDDTKRVAYTIHVLESEMLPHMGIEMGQETRVLFLLNMALKCLRTATDARGEDDRDHICNKRIEMVGDLMGNLIQSMFKRFLKTIQQSIEKRDEVRRVEDVNIGNIISRCNITQRMYYCFSTGNWGLPKSTYIRQGVSQILSRLSYIGTMSHLRRVVVPIGKKSRNTQVRQIHSTNFGFICPCETPEGQAVGIVKNFALLTKISGHVCAVDILGTMDRLFQGFDMHYILSPTYYCIYVNGRWVGCLHERDASQFVRAFKEYRALSILPPFASVGVDPFDMEIHVISDGGRILRPVLNVPMLPHLDRILAHVSVREVWDELIRENVVVYIDGNEAESSTIAIRLSEVEGDVHDYCEIHPSLMLGLCANTIPFPEHSQAPRNVYVSAMMKQAIGMYALSHNIRYDTLANVLSYPQRSLATTRYTRYCHAEELPSGQEVIVAIMCYTGFNQEDSVILNQSAIDRGLFWTTAYKTTFTSENKKGTHDCETIQVPPPHLCNATFNYGKLDERGIVRAGTQVGKNDVLVGKIYSANDTPLSDCSLACKTNEEGIVDKVLVTTNASGYKLVKIKIRQIKIPEIGDKFCQVSAQKGTCGMTYRQEDMPFNADGMVPDLIVNPHALPSRMTINMLLEMLTSKTACLTGEIQDASAFEHDGEELAEAVGNVLVKSGYNRMGTETLYNGFTGLPFKAAIFIGPAYYQRLKHLVSNKMHARSYGNVQLLSQQPCAGRAREGGLRFGEMEKDCMIVHGVSSFLKERLFDLSDPYRMNICIDCGVFVHSATSCMMCQSDRITCIHIPYACKLLFQQLEAMNVKIRIRAE